MFTDLTLGKLLNASIPTWQAILFTGGAVLAGRWLLPSLCPAKGYQRRKVPDSRRRLLATLQEESDEELLSGDEGESDGEEFDPNQEMKLVLVIRTDLGMGKGKVAAQCCHATLACYILASKICPELLERWKRHGQPKVTLKCNSEEEMLELQAKATSLGLVSKSILDAGRTQIAAGSRTVLGIGPGPVGVINKVTGHLKLY